MFCDWVSSLGLFICLFVASTSSATKLSPVCTLNSYALWFLMNKKKKKPIK